MDDTIISIKGLRKEFKVHERVKTGLFSSLKSLVSRNYKYIDAVNGVNIDIKKGEIRGLIGPNGAGKSTTIKILSGILFPTEGEVKVMGYVPWSQREEYVKNIGVVFGQKSQLWWDLPAIDTFALNKQLYNIPEDVFNYNVEYFKELLDIADVIKKPVRQLSLGERMKCELVCALIHEPPLVYLDEPTIGLDIISKEAMRGFIKQVNKDKRTTFIITTHDLDDIENLCGNVTIINKGTVVYDDSLDKLKGFFSTKKVIDVKFTEQIDDDMLKNLSVVSCEPFSAKFEIDLTKNDLKNEIQKIFAALPVNDININNIDIEEVIKHIYNNSNKSALMK